MQQDNLPYNPYGSVQIPPEQLRVGFGMRFLAWIVDVVLLLIISGVATVFLVKSGITVPMVNPESSSDVENMYRLMGIPADDASMYASIIAVYTYALVLITFGYSLISAMFGASPGKMMLGLIVAHADGSRGSISLWVRRWAVRDASAYLQVLALLPALAFLDLIGTFIGLIIFVGCFMAASQSRLALHDRIAQTAVFRRSDVY
ncbi:MAG: RDD family protein [bacterium]|nr:RDD family protein [bacterium]